MKPAAYLFAVLIALVLPAAATSAQGPTDWKQVPYFDASTSELRLQTTQPGWSANCDWGGPKAGTYATNVESPDWTAWGCLSNFLWAKTCTGSAQTVTFTKKVYLPGPAKDLDASLVSYGNRPLNMGIDINGSAALTAVKSIHKSDLRGKERLFKVGWNTVTVHARKANTGKDDCNRNGTEYAVFAQINAVFASDIKVTPPKGAQTDTGVFQGTFTVRNDGPSLSSTASVGFGAYTSKLKQISKSISNWAIIIKGPGVDVSKCFYAYSAVPYKQNSYTGYSASCPIGDLKPGESITITVTYQYLIPAGPFYDEWPIAWGAGGDLADPNPENSGGMRMQKACRNDPARPDPRCKRSTS